MDRPAGVRPPRDVLDTGCTDREIFAGLYAGLRRFAAVVGAVEMDPDDLVQEAVTRALAGGPLQRLDSPAAYLRRSIMNAASNDRRGAGRGQRAMVRLRGGLVEAEHPRYPSDLVELLGLSPRVRALLYLREVEGLAYREIAAIVGGNAAAARMTVSRALRTLRSSLPPGSTAKDHQ